ncbi:MAG: hypothetical protein ACK4LT_07175, partial [Aquificaceae bacterium]
MRKVLLFMIALLSLYGLTTAKEVPFTQEDRDRLIRVEVKVEAVEKRMDGLERQMDELRSDLRTYMSITLGALFTIIVGIIAL